jgi:hypothetical protein
MGAVVLADNRPKQHEGAVQNEWVFLQIFTQRGLCNNAA